MNHPWQPIYSVERSGIAELTIFGALAVVQGSLTGAPAGKLLSHGDTGQQLWTRSLLKPWQLLSHIDVLKKSFPALTDEHLTIMMASHSAEQFHQKLLSEIMQIGEVTEAVLKCPAAYPQDSALRNDLKAKHQPPRSFFHNCSGKHLGYVLSIKAEGGDPSNYLRVDEPQFGTLQNIVCDALDRPRSTLPVTTDGCQMPNYAISIEEMARLYVGLANAEHSQLANLASENRQYYMELSRLMGEHPQIIGGSDRLDTSVMSGALDLHGNPHVIAKEGADGMLAIGVGACERYPHGLGVLIKLSSGFDARHMEVIAKEIFAQLGLCTHPSSFPAQPEGARTDHLQIKFHFEINVKQPA